jgi:hypothetical protein
MKVLAEPATTHLRKAFPSQRNNLNGMFSSQPYRVRLLLPKHLETLHQILLRLNTRRVCGLTESGYSLSLGVTLTLLQI